VGGGGRAKRRGVGGGGGGGGGGRDFKFLSFGPYNGSDRKPKHIAVLSNKYVVSAEIHSI